MSEETKQWLILTVGICFFFTVLCGGLVYDSIRSNEVKIVCIEQGNSPDKC